MKNARTLAYLGLFVLSFLARPAEAADTQTTIAKVGNTELSAEQMRKDLGMQLYEAEQNLYMVQKNWIEQQAQNLLFDQAAKDAGLSRKKWEAQEIDAKTPPVDQNQALQMAGQAARPGVSSTETLKMVTDYIANNNKAARRNAIYQELLTKTPLTMMVSAPVAPKFEVTYTKDHPVRGPAKAPVTIVEFTDFECPWCKRSQTQVSEVEKAFSDKVKLVARQFPLPGHSRAFPASEAALCAKEQGKFWEFRDKLFERQALSEEDFQTYAKDLKLNLGKFDKCRSSHKYAAAVQGDIEYGSKVGVRGTPTFFVNGTQVAFTQLMDIVKTEIEKTK